MSFSAGQRLEARCTRCKDLTSHIVIVVVDAVPAKVECCACGSIHKYYPPAGAKTVKNNAPLRVSANQSRSSAVENRAKSQKAARAASASSSQSRSLKALKHSEDLEKLWTDSLANNFTTAKEYSTDIILTIGDTIEHSVFGTGIVQEIVGADKARILFKEGEKVLKCIAE